MNRLLACPCWFLIALLFAFPVEAQTVSSPLEAARAALAANDPARAALLLEPLTGPEGKDAAAFHLLSQVRLAERNAAQAVGAAEKATALDGTKPAYFAQLGIALGQRIGEVGFMEQAAMAVKLRKAFVHAVELDPNDLTGLIGLARFYTNAPEIAGGSAAKAMEFASRVQKLDPFLGALEQGNVASRDDRYAEALGFFEAAAQLRPGHAGAQNLRGQMLAKLGRKDEARACFEAALKLDPAFEAAKHGLAALDAPAAP